MKILIEMTEKEYDQYRAYLAVKEVRVLSGLVSKPKRLSDVK